jgi:hypothetical protein
MVQKSPVTALKIEIPARDDGSQQSMSEWTQSLLVSSHQRSSDDASNDEKGISGFRAIWGFRSISGCWDNIKTIVLLTNWPGNFLRKGIVMKHCRIGKTSG